MHEVIDGSMTLSDGTVISITANDQTLQDFGVTILYEEFKIEIFSENYDLIDAVLDLNIKSGLEEYEDWFDIIQVRISYFNFSCRLLKSEIDAIAGD